MTCKYDGAETTGFMSPAQDYVGSPIDLRDYLNLTAPSTYLSRVSGNLAQQDVRHDDLLVLSTSASLRNNDLVLMHTQGEVVLAAIEREGRAFLVNAGGQKRPLSEDEEVWAVVTAIIRKLR